MDALSDADLLTACRAGDREAFAVLLTRHHGLVRTACLRQAPPGEAEDCAQAVFLVLMRRPAAAARAPALAAWLLRVSWYVCRAARRAAKSRRTVERLAASSTTMTDSTRPAEALDHLDDCLARLPERQRAAISLQYLAGKAPDDVASELGVSRDNAYQLVSRGLATLRTLLARRGIAITAPALALLLAEQGQAAVSTAAVTTIISTALSAAPSANVATLATGATTAMTVSAIAPLAAVAGLLLPLSAATIILAADPPTPTLAASPTPPVIPAARPAGDWKARSETMLNLELSLDFKDTDYAEAISFLQRVTGQNIVVLPVVMSPAPGPVTLRVERTRLRDILALLDRQAKTTHVVRDDAIVITRPGPQQQPLARMDLSGMEHVPQLRDRMRQRISFDVVDMPSTAFIGFVSQTTGINVLETPAHQARGTSMTLKVKDMPLVDALSWVCELTDSTVSFQNNALIFDVPPAAGIMPAAVAPPAAAF